MNAQNPNPDAAQLRLRLRADLVVSPRTDEARTYYLIEDPVGAKYFRIGSAEYAFLSGLDGNTIVADAAEAVALRVPESTFSLGDALALSRWLVQHDLAHVEGQVSHGGAASVSQAAGQPRGWLRFNLLMLRLPLLHPDRLLDTITPYLSWLFSAAAFVVWSVIVVSAVYLIGGDGARFAASTEGIFAPGNWFWLILCWLLLKIVHEISHGVVCKRYGGDVREAGVLLILLFPAAYVDVTSSWRFPTRWQRIHVSVAGMYAELLLAAVAALAWTRLPAGPLNNLCANMVVMAGITTVLFNANPLMRFDGYYILSDLLGIPNLYSRGQRRLGLWVKRYLLGVDACPEVSQGWSGRTIAVYGVLSFAWRIMVCAGLLISASALFAGAGVVIAATGVITWLFAPGVRFVNYLVRGVPGEKPDLLRFAWVGPLSVACVVLPLCMVPWPGTRTAPAIVEHAPLTIVRASSPGFVREVRVTDGQQVHEGQILAVLENRDLEMELGDLELGIRQLDLKRRALAKSHRTAELQAHDEHRTALETKLAEKQAQVQRLSVRAPRSGRIVGGDLASLVGSYVKEGTTILTVVDEQSKELTISVAQQDLDPFTESLGRHVRVRLPGAARFSGTLANLDPRADLKPAHPALSATRGGPFAVRVTPDQHDQSDTETDQYELFSARFTGRVEISDDRSLGVRAGQRGMVALATYRDSIGGFIYRTVASWVRDRVRRAFGRSP